MIDLSVIEAVRKGQRDAFKLLYEASVGYVYSITSRYIPNQSDQPDVIQEVFARVFLGIGTFDPAKGEFKAWLRRLTVNQCMQHYRQGKSPRLYASLEAIDNYASDEEEHFAKMDINEIEAVYLKKMPDGYRQIFMLVIMDGYNHNEVAELLEITPETSRSQLLRAKRWLRNHLSISNNVQRLLAHGC